MLRDSLGNTYSKLPGKKPTKGAKKASPGPKHPTRHGDLKKKHGPETGRARKHEPQAYSRDFRQDRMLALNARRTTGPREGAKS